MLESLRPMLLRALKVPAEPAAQQGAVRVFRAAPGYFRYRLAGWLLKQAAAAAGILFGFAFLHAQPGLLPPTVRAIVLISEVLATAAFVAQIPFSLALLRLDYEMRWYIVGQRSLRVREGMINVREQTMTYANVQNISSNVSALTGVFAATLGTPVIKVAAFSYGVRRALGDNREKDIRRRIKTEAKASKAARKASRKASP